MSKSVGNKLRETRQARELSLEDVAKDTFLRTHYLKAIENGEFESLPSPVQARGFIRIYAGYLGIDAEALMAEMQEPTPQVSREIPTTPYSTPSSEIPSRPVDAEIPTHQAALQEGRPFFVDVGDRLREQRRVLGLSLQDVEKNTRLREHYLKALESGSFEELPSSVQGRGMLKNYAVFLGMDPEPLLLRFAEGLQAMLVVRQTGGVGSLPGPTHQEKPARLPSRLQRMISGELIVIILLVAAVVVFIGWALSQISTIGNQATPEVTSPSIADVLLVTATPSPQPSQQAGTIPPTPPNGSPVTQPDVVATTGISSLPPGIDSLPPGAVQVYLVVRQRAWVRVSVDGQVVFSGRVLPGSAYPFSGDDQVEVLTGNGAAIQVYYNRQDLGLMGLSGQVVDRIYTVQGILNPTPTVTPTVTATSPVTATPRVSVTPLP